MRFSGSIGAELAIAVGLISLLVFPARSMAQTAAPPATSQPACLWQSRSVDVQALGYTRVMSWMLR